MAWFIFFKDLHRKVLGQCPKELLQAVYQQLAQKKEKIHFYHRKSSLHMALLECICDFPFLPKNYYLESKITCTFWNFTIAFLFIEVYILQRHFI